MTATERYALAKWRAERFVTFEAAWYRTGDNDLLDAANEEWIAGCGLIGRVAFDVLVQQSTS